MISKRTKKLPLTAHELALYREACTDILRARPQEDARRLPLTSRSERDLMEYFRDGFERARPSPEQYNQLSPQNRLRLHHIEWARTNKLVQQQRQEMEERQREAEAASRVVIKLED